MSWKPNTRVPVEMIKPLLPDTSLPNVAADIAERVGKTEDYIQKLATRVKFKTVSFDFADSLVCATEGPQWWYATDERMGFYLGLNLSGTKSN